MNTTSAPSMLLTDLPTSLLSEICGLATGSGSPRTIGAVACCCKTTRKAAEEGAPWQRSVSLRWGIQARPLALPSWAALSRVLEQDVGQHLRYVDEHSTTSVRKAVAVLRRDVLAASDDGGRVAIAGSEQVCLHALLRRAPLGLRRRLAAFVCMTSESLPRDSTYLKLFMAGLDLDDLQTPEAALRAVLLQFPFLPLDAGVGADRVIGAVAKAFLERCAPADLAGWLPHGDGLMEKERSDAAHILIYSLIMLNTDLHNPTVQPKMTVEEFVASCHRAPLLALVPDGIIANMFRSIQESPLQIEQHGAGVDSIVRCSRDRDGEDVVQPARYSRYSSHGGVAGVSRGSIPRAPPNRRDAPTVAALLWACMALRPDPVAVFELRRHRAQRWGELRVAGWALALLAALLCYLLVGPRVAACCFVLVAAACAALLRA